MDWDQVLDVLAAADPASWAAVSDGAWHRLVVRMNDPKDLKPVSDEILWIRYYLIRRAARRRRRAALG